MPFANEAPERYLVGRGGAAQGIHLAGKEPVLAPGPGLILCAIGFVFNEC